MAAEIKTIHGGAAPNAPNKELVETLEGLLTEAMSGSLQAMAFATVRSNKAKGTGWNGAAGTRDALGMSIHMLAQRYTKACLDGD